MKFLATPLLASTKRMPGSTIQRANHPSKIEKVKFPNIRFRALGLELIPVYRQSARPHVTLSHPPRGRLRLLSVRPAVTFPAHRLVPNYTAWWQRHMRVSSLSKAITSKRTRDLLARNCYATQAVQVTQVARPKAPFTLEVYFEILLWNKNFEFFLMKVSTFTLEINFRNQTSSTLHSMFVNTGRLTNHSAP